MYQIRVHGLGGQGAVTLVTWVARAAYMTGKHVQAFPFFGAERRGAPVKAFVRIDDEPINLRSQVYNPDLLVIMNRDLIEPAMEDGISPEGRVFLDGEAALAMRVSEDLDRDVWFLDATGIAIDLGLEIEGMPMVNIPLLGSLVKESNAAPLDTLLELVSSIASRRGMTDEYIEAATRGFEEIQKAGETSRAATERG